MITIHHQTLRAGLTREVIARARDAGDRAVMDAGYRCLAAWRLGRQAPPEDWRLVREFAD